MGGKVLQANVVAFQLSFLSSRRMFLPLSRPPALALRVQVPD